MSDVLCIKIDKPLKGSVLITVCNDVHKIDRILTFSWQIRVQSNFNVIRLYAEFIQLLQESKKIGMTKATIDHHRGFN